MDWISLDIETTGLNPWEDRVVTAALSDGDRFDEVFDWPDDERTLLEDLDFWFYSRPKPVHRIVTWNGSEFDLPFLACRYALNGLPQEGPTVVPSGEVGKYGKPRYKGMWNDAIELDISYRYKKVADDLGVKWSLKPVAEALGHEVISFDFSKKITRQGPCLHVNNSGVAEHEFDLIYREQNILDLSSKERRMYCLSDTRTTAKLYAELVDKSKGQAVLLEGDVSLL